MSACHCHDDKFYKNLSCALIGELINSTPTPSSDFPISLSLNTRRYYATIRNGYFTGDSILLITIINNSQNPETAYDVDIYQNDSIIFNINEGFREEIRGRTYPVCSDRDALAALSEAGPIKEGVNTYYAKDKISGAISNKFILENRSQ